VRRGVAAGAQPLPAAARRYRERLPGGDDLPAARRFFRSNDTCAKATFAEQVPGLTTRYGRRTCGLEGTLQAIALALGGRAGARLSSRPACSASRSTLLRLIRAAPDLAGGIRVVLGVDLSRSWDYPDRWRGRDGMPRWRACP
jgi:hypothetical protein